MKLQNGIMDILKEPKNFLSYILLFIILYIFIGIMISFESTLFQISLASFGSFQVVFRRENSRATPALSTQNC